MAERLSASDVQADRHQEIEEAAAVGRLDQTRAQRRDQLEQDVARVDRLESVAQELRVEADLQRLAMEWHRQRLARLTDVGGPRRHRQLTLGEGQSQRRV